MSVGETWVEVGRARRYTPCQDDVGFVLKYEASIIDAARQFEACRPGAAFSSRVRPAPNLPPRALVALPTTGAPAGGGARFTLLSYNILADLYAKADGHSQCPAWVMAWPYRKQNLLRELLTRRPDVMCLQEVQSDHYADWLLPELTKAGYLGIFKKKTTEIFTGTAYAIDGCATFFRRDRFALVKKYEVEFNKAAVSLAEQMPNPGQKKATMNRLLKDNVALIAVLEAADGGDAGGAAGGAAGAGGAGAGARGGKQLICVANTHIHANPELNDVKLWQVHTLLKGLEKIANSADIPMLVAGDFNSTPGSAAHSLLVRGRVDPSQLVRARCVCVCVRFACVCVLLRLCCACVPLELRCAAGCSQPFTNTKTQTLTLNQKRHQNAIKPNQNQDPSMDPLHLLRDQKLQHALPLASAYAALWDQPPTSEALRRQRARLDPAHHEPLFTNLSRDYRGTLDYILYTRDSLAPRALLELPSDAEVGARPGEGLPNANWSSDHVSLMAEFQVVSGGGGGGAGA